jgi:pullulanase-type alpha-1,6-glucosidase
MSQTLKEAFPYLSDFRRFTLGTDITDNVKSILKKQVLLMVTDVDGTTPIHVTGVQLGYVLDTTYPNAKNMKPGVVWDANQTPTVSVWAPTATSVTLNVYDNPTGGSATTHAMTEDPATGGWSYVGDSGLKGKYYTFSVNVYAHSIADFVTNEVTDPYSYSLSMNGGRSQFVNLKDAALKPTGWDALAKKSLGNIADATVYEMMIRDFSAASSDVSANYRGGFMAFTETASKGMTHLKNLAKAGLTHLEIGPAFDIVSVNEDKSEWDSVDETALNNATPNGTTQRDAVKAVQNSDGFNWGYDPMHYTVPDGSFATDPNGSQRVLEFRSMVKGLASVGLRTTMDVVYNHTSSSGQKTNSVLDKIVPGYYYRLTTSGTVETSTCCQNTASERAMMAKLMRDSIRTWAVDYKVDGFRFDLMGHHPKALMVQIRKDLDALTIANSGVDGKKILLFGEGWNYGEVVDNSRFVNATQNNMAGTRVGTFDDRMRDAVRGGGPFDNDPRKQGFGSGINSAPNGASLSASTDDKLQQTDWVKAALGGSVSNLEFMTMFDWKDTAGNIGYNGNGAGYTTNPVEQIAYVDAHDNETLYDSIAYKVPATTTMANRIRYQNISLAVSLLSEGIPFTLAGSDLLRSKSLDRDSYNSGDWFNAIHWDLSTNGFGRGLPINLTGEGDSDTTIKARAISLLGRATLKPTAAEMTKSSKLYQELLKVRYSSPLFRLATGANVTKRVKFLNGGSKAKLGFIVEQILDTGKGITNIDKKYKSVVIVYNTTSKAVSYTVKALKSATFILNPVQAASVDSVVKTSKFKAGVFTVPALTVAVFMQTK